MTFVVPDHLIRRFERAQRRIESDLAAIATESGLEALPRNLTHAQSRILQMIPPRGITATELSVHARITKQGLGQMVDILEERGLVTRRTDLRDRRARVIRRTELGDRVYESINGWIETLQTHLQEVLGAELYESFWEALEILGHDEIDPYTDPSAATGNTDEESDNT